MEATRDKQREAHETSSRICINKIKIFIRTCIYSGVNRPVHSRTRSIRADSGEQGRGLIAAPMSVLERRCQKSPGSLRTSTPAFHFPFHIPLYCLIFGPSESSALAFLTLIPRSSLVTRLSRSICVCLWCNIPPQSGEVRGHVHVRTNHLISKCMQKCFETVIRPLSNTCYIHDLCLLLIRAASLQIKHQLAKPHPRTELIMVVWGAAAQRSYNCWHAYWMPFYI